MQKSKAKNIEAKGAIQVASEILRSLLHIHSPNKETQKKIVKRYKIGHEKICTWELQKPKIT